MKRRAQGLAVFLTVSRRQRARKGQARIEKTASNRVTSTTPTEESRAMPAPGPT